MADEQKDSDKKLNEAGRINYYADRFLGADSGGVIGFVSMFGWISDGINHAPRLFGGNKISERPFLGSAQIGDNLRGGYAWLRENDPLNPRKAGEAKDSIDKVVGFAADIGGGIAAGAGTGLAVKTVAGVVEGYSAATTATKTVAAAGAATATTATTGAGTAGTTSTATQAASEKGFLSRAWTWTTTRSARSIAYDSKMPLQEKLLLLEQRGGEGSQSYVRFLLERARKVGVSADERKVISSAIESANSQLSAGTRTALADILKETGNRGKIVSAFYKATTPVTTAWANPTDAAINAGQTVLRTGTKIAATPLRVGWSGAKDLASGNILKAGGKFTAAATLATAEVAGANLLLNATVPEAEKERVAARAGQNPGAPSGSPNAPVTAGGASGSAPAGGSANSPQASAPEEQGWGNWAWDNTLGRFFNQQSSPGSGGRRASGGGWSIPGFGEFGEFLNGITSLFGDNKLALGLVAATGLLSGEDFKSKMLNMVLMGIVATVATSLISGMMHPTPATMAADNNKPNVPLQPQPAGAKPG